jgi:hypothetical protein
MKVRIWGGFLFHPLKNPSSIMFTAMTDSQRQANQQQQPMNATAKDAQFDKRIEANWGWEKGNWQFIQMCKMPFSYPQEIRRSTNRQQFDPIVEQLTSQLHGSGLGKH